MARRFWLQPAAIVVVHACISAAPVTADGAPPNLHFESEFGGFSSSDGLDHFKNKSLQKELLLTSEQSAALQRLKSEMEAQRNIDLQGLKGAAGPLTDRDFMKLAASLLAKERSRIGDKLKTILSEAQLARLRQLSLQLRGSNAFFQQSVAKSLNLTDEQRNRIREIQDRSLKEWSSKSAGEAERSTGATSDDVDRFSKDLLDRVLEVLTDEQRRKFDEMLGAKADALIQELRREGRESRLKSRPHITESIGAKRVPFGGSEGNHENGEGK
jgi:Spy/CpxP family protein refolding chaperone